MALMRYFTEFGSFRGSLRKSDWQSRNYGQLTIQLTNSINSRLNEQYMSFRLLPKSVTSNDLERWNGHNLLTNYDYYVG